MGVLSAAQRKALPASDFALPGGRYPIEDQGHAMAALSRVSQFGTSAEQARVRAAVASRYPGMGDSDSGREDNERRKQAVLDAMRGDDQDDPPKRY